MRASDIFGFRPIPVSLLTVVTYIVIASVLLWNHLVPPKLPHTSEIKSWGVDLDEAWADLQTITRDFHPYNSKSNDAVRVYLVERIREILAENGVEGFADQKGDDAYKGEVELIDDDGRGATNVTYAGSKGLSVYFEGTNIIVRIEGTISNVSPVLVNAHYDSVSTGYGATDDGVGVISILHVIKSFTRPKAKGGKRIQRGLIALLNNGEEDYLNGAKAFAAHPVSQLPHSFLNLEGAGAGGRAILFRSTDAEVTKFYKSADRPYGTSLTDDGFKKGLVRSETDYKIFNGDLGMRGLDVAFWHPRSRYHTSQDNAAHTSKTSLWHMLGSSLQTLKAMTDDTTNEFDHPGEAPAGTGHRAAWFDLFGQTFAVMRLTTLFALAITLLVVPTVGMALTFYILHRSEKLYYFSNTSHYPQPPEHSRIPATTRGWRGFIRFPLAFVVASAAVTGAAYLVNRANPMIAHSSEYSIWTMFLSLWFCITWFILSGADKFRASALSRGYSFIHQWILWFAVLVAASVSIDRAHLGSGYWVLIVYTAVWLSSWIGLLELFGLERKSEHCGVENAGGYESEGHSQVAAGDEAPRVADDNDVEDTTEETPLFRGENRPTSFAYGTRGRRAESPTEPEKVEGVYGDEQAWSKDMPTWLWLLQFLLAVPVPLIFVGSAGLFAITSISQTGADGNSMLTVYILAAAFSVFMLLPATPFLHRVTWQIATFVFLVFVGTFIYNLSAFPFSPENQLKVFFRQDVDLETGLNKIHAVGHDRYIKNIVEQIPSAKGQVFDVVADPLRLGLTRVSWPGPSPKVVPAGLAGIPPEAGMRDWVTYNITKLADGKAKIFVRGRNTRNCKIQFDKSIWGITVLDALGEDTPSEGKFSHSVSEHSASEHNSVDPFRVSATGDPIPEGGTRELRLWSREWERGWTVIVNWRQPANTTTANTGGPVHTELTKRDEGEHGGLDGRVICMWSDANRVEDEIPALDEAIKFLPNWATVTKLTDGLVEGGRPFMV